MLAAIVDLDMGNIFSVEKALRRVGADVVVTRDEKLLKSADRLVLPGVGHFEAGMSKIELHAMRDPLNRLVHEQGIPILGICLGMQLMTMRSDEANVRGLGWVPASTLDFAPQVRETRLKVPHMGWNSVNPSRTSEWLTRDIGSDDQFYFVHSYYIECENPDDVVARTRYALDFVSAFRRGNVYGVQFHPEKSHTSGLKILANFLSGV